ncbi:MAG: 3-(3-hydroxyphenyl)propionate hydroxylase [Alphaproteobacteria bacterium]|nr:3-(3-hydroxyphenyl)propionate hydroxylase [Alphaproteobacteria bacterium]
MQYENDALIVGAGPAGLTLAIDLARRGVSFRLIDAAASPFIGSRGKGLQPRTLEIFDDLGVIDAIMAAGGPYPRLRLHFGPFSFRGGSLGTNKRPSESTPYPNLLMVPQARTEAILRDRLKELGHEAQFGCALHSFTQASDGVVSELSTGETVRTKFLVGADGGHSTVRKILDVKLAGNALGDRSMLVADVEVAGLDRRDWHIWPFAKGGAVALCPLPHSDLFQFTAPAAIAESDIEAVVRKVSGRKVVRVPWRSTYRPSVRMVEHYRVGRVVLAGDAAHVHPPAGGQGLNTSVQDAYNLGWKLAHVLRGGGDSLLDTYEAERLPVAASVLGLTKELHLSQSVRRGDRTNQLSLNYRSSPLSSGEAYAGLHPGDRMPDARLADGSRLFDRLRGPQGADIVTPKGLWILVRPDGYIAHIGHDRSGPYANLKIPASQVELDL